MVDNAPLSAGPPHRAADQNIRNSVEKRCSLASRPTSPGETGYPKCLARARDRRSRARRTAISGVCWSVMRASLLIVIALGAAPAVPQSVSAEQGNIVFADQSGTSRRLTATHLDSDPSLSFDNRQMVFVRRTPKRTIITALGKVDKNELWISLVDRPEETRRVLEGHPGDYNTESNNMVLAGFATPQFSPDGRRVYFAAETWVTAAAIHMLDLTTGKTRFLFPGLGLEVIRKGKYKGFLIGTKDPITENRGRIEVYWLLDPDGSEVRRIGETEADVTRFKDLIKERSAAH